MAGLPASIGTSSTHYLGHFASNSRWYTGLGVANPNGSTATVAFTAYSETGASLGTANRQVLANGKISETVTTLFGGTVSGTGWILVSSDIGVQVFDLYGDSISGGVAALPSAIKGTSLVLPHFVQSTRWWTGVSVMNPGTLSSTVTMKAYSADGTLLDSRTQSLDAHCKIVGYVESLLPLTANHTGWILVEADRAVTGLLLYGDKQAVPNRIAALPAVPASTAVKLSNFFQDSDWWTGIALVNPNAGAANVTLVAYAPDGTVIESVSQTIAGLSKTLGYVSTYFNLGIHSQGWVKATSDVPLAGMEILNADDATEQAYGLAGIESQDSAIILNMPHYVVSSRWWTLFALANQGTGTANVTLNAFENNGTPAATHSQTIPLHGRLADYVKDLFEW
jgi:hypothetical protein